MDSFTALLPAGATVLEVGSGPGRAATYLESKHLSVRRTDATPAFVQMMHADGHDANVLDIRTDDLGGPYDAILAIAVLLHLSRREFETFMHRAREAIAPGGLLAFTMKEGDGSEWTTEKLALPRHFTYWRERDLRTLMARTGWTPLSFSQIRMNESWIFVIARSDTTNDRLRRKPLSPADNSAEPGATTKNGGLQLAPRLRRGSNRVRRQAPGPRPGWLGSHEGEGRGQTWTRK
ncbi:class I SAM-dependent DNA methyltransferase [Gordonia sp. NPDC127522]|uniref:class I SAM-dependent DNA methyltransferase n=1 Tax=Gordonia sp. NPDC127522 TaxID=3345390 RepID=UPI0036315DAD